MPTLKPYTGPTKLVVAFDIGATFSGVSYCILEKGQVPEVLWVTRFPGQLQTCGDAKAPSLLYYDKSGTVRAAGAEVLAESVIEAALMEEWTRAEWWKLHLCPKHLVSSINMGDALPPLPSGKSAVDVLTDFVEYLFRCVKGYIQTHHLAFSWSTIDQSIEYIFTHPNGWEGEQQQMYRKAIEGAGLVPGTPEGRSRVHMLTEGEATLHFCVPNIVNPEAMNQTGPQEVVIIDGGGATISLSMFSMESNPISCTEIAPAECRLQGSVFVTRRAKVLLQKKLKGWERSSPSDIDEFTREFDQSTKLIIKSDQELAFIRVASRRYNNATYNISYGKLKLTGEEATGLFNETIDAIIDAFEQQEKVAKTPITMVFFVGGLSTNDWLWSRLQLYFIGKNIIICRPDNHINKAVANGAVLSHVDSENHQVLRVAYATCGVVGWSDMSPDNNCKTVASILVEEQAVAPLATKEVQPGWKLDGKLSLLGHAKSFFRKSAPGTSSDHIAEDAGDAWEEQEIEGLRQDLATSRNNGPQKLREAQPRKKATEIRELQVEVTTTTTTTTTQFTELQDRYAAQSQELVSLRNQLQALTQSDQEKDHVISSIALERDVETSANAARKDQIRELQLEVTTTTTKFTELKDRYAAHSQKFVSLRNQLQTLTQSNQEKDRAISSVTLERDVQTSANASKADQITNLQYKLSYSTSQFTELQDRYRVLVDELGSVNSKLQMSVSSSGDKEHQVTLLMDEIKHLKSELSGIQDRRRDVQRIPSTADLYADETVISMLNRLNAEVQQNMIYMAEVVAEDFQHHDGKTTEEEAIEVLRNMLERFDEEMSASKEWIKDFKNKCIDRLEVLGDEALGSGETDEAVSRYSSALSLDPLNPMYILLKRSKALASKELWKDALRDADEVIRRDPSSYFGYERKLVMLRDMQDYGEANDTLLRMLSIMEQSPDAEIRGMCANYINPCKAISAIDTAIHEIFTLCPLVLIDVMTGRLCDADERLQMFKSEAPFKKLVSDASVAKLDYSRTRQAVAEYFKWIMFSHTWEGKEPTFQEVNLVESVRSLGQSPLNDKLRRFCEVVSEDGYRWAWSDTCCIDKTTSAVLSQSLISMYTWYEEAEETIVYLEDVLSSAELGALRNSRWMTRAWTLQELLASKVVRFYTRDWTPYLGDQRANHKESPAIKQELAQAMGVMPTTIKSFRPEDLGVREKLRLASTRNATRVEDIAYSLIGIFSSDIVPRYGLGKTALGHLLENIVARTGDVTVISWTGKPSRYNSALPDSLGVYSQTTDFPSPMDANELDTCVERLRTQLARESVLAFHAQIARLPRATFSDRCLRLPCILFPVTHVSIQDLDRHSQSIRVLYRLKVSSLENVEFWTAQVVPRTARSLVLIHPWLCDIVDPLERRVLDDAGPSDSARVDSHTLALRMMCRLGRPFNALLVEQQPDGRHKRVASDCEIMIPGIPHQTNPRDVQVTVLEIV